MVHRTRCARAAAAVALLAVGAAVLPVGSASAAEPLDGVWRMDGYGTVLSVAHGRLRAFQTTAVSCLPGEVAERSGPTARDGSVTYTTSHKDVYTVRPSDLPDSAALRVAGSPGERGLRRIGALPAACAHRAPSDPVAVFETFWRTFAENYPFFAAKGVNWQETYGRYRPRVNATTSDGQLFTVLRDMVAPLNDAHVHLYDGGARYFGQGRPGTVVPGPALDARVKAYVKDRDLRGRPLREFAGGRIGYADLPGGLGYLRVSGFGGYSADRDDPYTADEQALDRALDTVFSAERTRALKGLAIDLRVNGGGYDELGLRIASRLTDRPYLAYAKRHRDDPGDPGRFSRPQPITVRPAGAPRYTGPLAVLTGGSTVSAGETFTQALIGRPGRTVRIGENTQGVFSDVLDRDLPNGWTFGLPNEEFLTRDGRTFDGQGIPPDIREPVFTAGEFGHRRDSAFDAAVALLGGRG
ncbi:S41 family peptidase [Streptomyces sp. RPT161]|uniref:S41 family peptidase n=1 Tax=Streptomyces sp. RPT161 TaxID=3015993 RepID=UPI0022B8E61A|nr:S41 family peptidase [Streptomyces sp. RPT161]